MIPSETYINEVMPSVPGWFYQACAICFLAINQIQRQEAIPGSLAEVGVYGGKSLGLLATFLKEDERLCGIDLFNIPGLLEKTKETLAKVTDDFARLQLVTANSMELQEAKLAEIMPGALRFLHVDGNHDYEFTLSDLRKFGARVSARGVIAVDDYYDRDFPGVCAATNDFIRESGFTPFLASSLKLYLCRLDQVEFYVSQLLAMQPFQTNARVERFKDLPMLVSFTSKPFGHQENVDRFRRECEVAISADN